MDDLGKEWPALMYIGRKSISVHDLQIGTEVMVYDKYDGTWRAEITDFDMDGSIKFVLSGDDKVHVGTLSTIAKIVSQP